MLGILWYVGIGFDKYNMIVITKIGMDTLNVDNNNDFEFMFAKRSGRSLGMYLTWFNTKFILIPLIPTIILKPQANTLHLPVHMARVGDTTQNG